MKYPTSYRTTQIDGLSIFYREAGPKDAPTLLLLHGLPSSSRMFEPLFTRLSDRYHLVAPAQCICRTTAAPLVFAWRWLIPIVSRALSFKTRLRTTKAWVRIGRPGASFGPIREARSRQRARLLFPAKRGCHFGYLREQEECNHAF